VADATPRSDAPPARAALGTGRRRFLFVRRTVRTTLLALAVSAAPIPPDVPLPGGAATARAADEVERGGPSVAYEEAMAHADDVIDFDAGLTPEATMGDSSDLAGGVGSTTAADLQALRPATLRREVFGFLPYWELPTAAGRLDLRVLSTVAYFSVGADPNGSLLKRNADGSTAVGWAGWRSRRMTDFIARAHREGAKVVLTVSVFAWTTSQARTQRSILASPARRARLARQIAAEIQQRGADGVNLDFEPLVRGMEGEYVAFVRTLRRELDRRARGYQLTFDTTGIIGNYPIERLTARGAADAVFVMGYDYRGARSERAGSIDPLEGARYDLTDTVRAYTSRIPPRKVILGLPWYGRAWSTTSPDVRAPNQSGTRFGASVAVPYDAAAEFASRYGRYWDSGELSSWVRYRKSTCTDAYGCQTSWRQIYFDDASSLRLRYDLVNRYGLRGAGIWALGYDGGRPELFAGLGEKFADASPTVRVALNSRTISPNGDGQLDAAVLTLAMQGGSTWQVQLRSPEGDLIRTNTGTGSRSAITWDARLPDGRGVADGRYRFDVAVRDAAGRTTARRLNLDVDRAAPAVDASVDPAAFSPDGDDVADRAVVRWVTSERAVGFARLLRDGGRERAWSIAPGTAGSIPLDGRDGRGRPLRDGRYVLRLVLRDAARNERVQDIPVVVDRTARRLRWSNSFYPQDRDRTAANASVTFRLARPATVSLRIEDESGRIVRHAYRNRRLAAGERSWTWDGRTGNGSWAAQGRYRAVLTSTTSLGTQVLTRDVFAAAYRTSIPATVAVGDALEVRFDSVEPLSAEPAVVFTSPGRGAISLGAKRTSNGRYRAAFRIRAADVGEATVRISALDAAGRWNTEIRTVTIR